MKDSLASISLMDTLLITHTTACIYWIGGPKRLHPDYSIGKVSPDERFVFRKDLVDDARRLLAGNDSAVIDACVFSVADRHIVPGGRCHFLRHQMVGGRVCRLSDSLAIATPEMLFCMLANNASMQELIVLGNALCSTYPVLRNEFQLIDEVSPLTTINRIEKFLSGCEHLGGAKKAKQALQWVCEGSASQREVTLASIFFTPRCYGGYGFPKPQQNFRITLNRGAREILDQEFIVADYVWADKRVAIEYDSNKFHSSTEKLAKDSARRNALLRMGYQTVVVTNEMIVNKSGRDGVAQTLTKLLYNGKRKPYKVDDSKRLALIDAAFGIPSGRI